MFSYMEAQSIGGPPLPENVVQYRIIHSQPWFEKNCIPLGILALGRSPRRVDSCLVLSLLYGDTLKKMCE